MKSSLITLLCLSTGVGLCLAALPGQAELFRWVDENGVAHYGDRIPPQYSKQRREVMNERGYVVNVKERERTEAELSAIAEQKRLEQARAAEAAQQAQYDRSLTATYESLAQLDSAYEDRLAIIDAKINTTEKAENDLLLGVADLRKRAGDSPSAGLQRRIDEKKVQLREQGNLLRRLKSTRTELAQRYNKDRARYITLTAQRDAPPR
ncbi:MAG: hypothetical protein CMN28_13965 [Salinisphaeraceae bacterium]|nr:hypothetical protein [Salinisphaeraceae bacterium]